MTCSICTGAQFSLYSRLKRKKKKKKKADKCEVTQKGNLYFLQSVRIADLCQNLRFHFKLNIEKQEVKQENNILCKIFILRKQNYASQKICVTVLTCISQKRQSGYRKFKRKQCGMYSTHHTHKVSVLYDAAPA